MGSRSSSSVAAAKSSKKVAAAKPVKTTSKRQPKAQSGSSTNAAANGADSEVVEVEEEEEEEEEEEYEVETIVTHKKTNAGSLLFLLKWKNYPDSENTWEAQEDLNCHDLVCQYLQEHNIDNKGNSTKPAPAATPVRTKRSANASSPPSSTKKLKTSTAADSKSRASTDKSNHVANEAAEMVHKLDDNLSSWEDFLIIETIGMADEEGGHEPTSLNDRNQLTVFGIDSNGNRVCELLKDVRIKAPQRLLDFLLDHLKFRS